MGFKTFTVFVSEEPGYFGTKPRHDPSQAERLLLDLGLTRCTLVEHNVPLNDYPRDNDLYIGVYPKGVVIAHEELPAAFFDAKSRLKNFGPIPDRSDFARRYSNLFPQGEVIALILHSVVDLWGFSVYKNGVPIRVASGADGEFFGSIGDQLPEESTILVEHAIESLDEVGLGEELVFEVARRVFGFRYDDEDLSEVLMCSHYRMDPKVQSTWSKLWSFVKIVADLPGLIFDRVFGK
jgi:hypothetical protein